MQNCDQKHMFKSALKNSKAQNEQDVKESIIELIEIRLIHYPILKPERETGVAVQQLVEACTGYRSRKKIWLMSFEILKSICKKKRQVKLAVL